MKGNSTMDKIIEKIFTTEERKEFITAFKEMLLNTLEDEIDDFRKDEWMFNTDFIRDSLTEMFDEVYKEVREELKGKMMDVMMKKLSDSGVL